MSFSGGVASCTTDGDSPEKLIESADKAMYVSKKCGRARTTVYSRIWLGNIKAIAVALTVAVIVGVVALGLTLSSSGSFPKFLGSFPTKKITNPFRGGGARDRGKGIVTVRLKSGSVIKGKIIKENQNEIEIGLSLDKGEGSLTIKRANITSIEY